MTLHLVVHRPAAEGEAAEAERAALQEAVWEVADSHWAPAEGALLVSCDLSAAYLVSHFRGGMARRGHKEPGLLMVVPMNAESAWLGLPEDGEEWVRGAL
ncbi:hypothetical protein [Roseomonas sp. AR75]|jgi:hypothetical protein|uniref:hypothetical protein n=1 Tax=Roseomonas sp. AR75 TaxID=2562311 RepID=UPI0010C0B621|nr:hypothetical protein [Roseomonas sp. AR75]